MITIILNGEQKQVAINSTIEQLLKELDLENRRLAVEVNQEIVPRSKFSAYVLNAADKIEIVHAIGGGTC